MKTLFILTGQLRGFNHSYPTIKKFLEPHFGEVDYLFFYLKESVLVEDLMPQFKIIHSSFIEKNPVSEVQAEWGVPPKGMAVMMQWYMGYKPILQDYVSQRELGGSRLDWWISSEEPLSLCL